jgi:hypothetical protein
MNANDITEGNKIIAEFTGAKIANTNIPNIRKGDRCYWEGDRPSYNGIHSEELKYHSSWDWLMPVLTEIGNRTSEELVMYSETCYWNNFGDNNLPTEFLGYGYPLVDGVWLAVVEFIKWYNSQNK